MALYDTLYDELSNGTSAEDIIKLLALAQEAARSQVDEDSSGWDPYWGNADDYDLHECIEDLADAMTAFEIAIGTIETKDAADEYDRTINELKALAKVVAHITSEGTKDAKDALKKFVKSLD